MTKSKPDERYEAVIKLGDASWHDGPGWYYYEAEYPEEGTCGAFKTREEAKQHAEQLGYFISDA